MSLKTESVKIECASCAGTGIYHGFAEPKGVGVVCLNCHGSGCVEFKYAPFTKRQHREGITTVRTSRGSLLVTGVGPTGDSVTYHEFMSGKMPK